MLAKLGICNLVCWAVAIAAGIWTYWVSVEDFSIIPALLIGAAVASFLGLVLSQMLCGRFGSADADADAGGHAGAAAGAVGAVAAGAAVAGDKGHADDGAANADADALKAAEAEAAEAVAKAEADVKAAEEAAAAEKAKAEADAKAAEEAAAAEKAKAEADAKAAADAAAAEKAKAEAASIPDYDKDGVYEGTDEGVKPAALDGPRDGGADNLKEIKGIGPKLEKLCNSLGFYHFDQIAAWTADEVAWVDANLQGFRGRVSRDEWVAQAKILAAGGETEFSKRVDDGKVY